MRTRSPASARELSQRHLKYLNLYYSGRDKLPPDETNGNTPLVSAHEVAWYAWTATKDPRMGELIAKGEVKNMIDLCYQTLALAEIDRAKYADQIAKNAERILSLQRPDGQWSARFEAKQPAVEFQTGHALWALQAAGIPAIQSAGRERDRLPAEAAAGIRRLDGSAAVLRELPHAFPRDADGDPRAQLLLPVAGRAKGWNSPQTRPPVLGSGRNAASNSMRCGIRHRPRSASRSKRPPQSNDALIRQAAVEALGRLGWPCTRSCSEIPANWCSALPPGRCGNPTAGTQRHRRSRFSVLWLRQTTARAGALRACSPPISRHWRRRPEWPPRSVESGDDPADQYPHAGGQRHVAVLVLGVRLSVQGPDRGHPAGRSWQAAAGSGSQRNLRPGHLQPGGREHPVSVQQLGSAAGARGGPRPGGRGPASPSKRGSPTNSPRSSRTAPEKQKKELLRSLTELPLRRGDIYDLEADLGKTAPPVYNRIGNDIEQIAFFGQSRGTYGARHSAAARLYGRRNAPARSAGRPAGPRHPFCRSESHRGPCRHADAADPCQGREDAGGCRGSACVEAACTLRHRKKHNGKIRAASATKLDEAYFRGYVEPILQKRGKDGYACVHCHASHTLFDGTWSTVKNVVNTAEPEESLILRKPTSSSETEGIVNSGSIAHGGGVRFAKDSPEYVIILDWIKGNKE